MGCDAGASHAIIMLRQSIQGFRRAFRASAGHSELPQGIRSFRRAFRASAGHSELPQGIQSFRRAFRASAGHSGLPQGIQGFRRAFRASAGHSELPQGIQSFRRAFRASAGQARWTQCSAVEVVADDRTPTVALAPPRFSGRSACTSRRGSMERACCRASDLPMFASSECSAIVANTAACLAACCSRSSARASCRSIWPASRNGGISPLGTLRYCGWSDQAGGASVPGFTTIARLASETWLDR